MLNEVAIRNYFFSKFPRASHVEIRKLGSGVQGSGFLIDIDSPAGENSFVIKTLLSEGLGHDYSSDRASVFLLDLDEFNNLPKHVKAIDVLSEMGDGSVKSIGGGREYYLLMEKGYGTDYFTDLNRYSNKAAPDTEDIAKIRAMTSYLADIHAAKKDSKILYWRKLRDTVGHGECLMGVFDTYPEGTLPDDVMTGIIKKSVDWIYRLKPKYSRLSQIHGDFHPGNIWFNRLDDFILLDRSRGPWGEPADDVIALTINYIFFSVRLFGDVRGAYFDGLSLFFDEYLKATGDFELLQVVAPFIAFRISVVANPIFYPDLSKEKRHMLLRFADNVLSAESFDLNRVNEYLNM